MTRGKWTVLRNGPLPVECFLCKDLLRKGDDAYETEDGTFCTKTVP
jgi:hypothetical protein